MELADLTGTVLSYIVSYGPIALGAVVLLAALGLPLPSTFAVLASGAFVQQGVLDLPSTAVVALICVVLGDTLSYGLGRLLRRPIQARFGRTEAWRRAEASFARGGGLAIFLSRWLLTPIAVPTNLVAGSSNYAAGRFVALSAAGELTWILLFGALGYLFGSQWETVSVLVSNLSGPLVALAVAGAGLVALVRHYAPLRAARLQA